ncbi:hypothetical protein L484_022845 [Morus notabilis]|uniref:Uncharacterized protein n=1 Tax=Morus notabilis TaxID=981085 RepID=W9STY7_9ROSA|nr:hypothetical protein L484_022845 [Morus notabilis]
MDRNGLAAVFLFFLIVSDFSDASSLLFNLGKFVVTKDSVPGSPVPISGNGTTTEKNLDPKPAKETQTSDEKKLDPKPANKTSTGKESDTQTGNETSNEKPVPPVPKDSPVQPSDKDTSNSQPQNGKTEKKKEEKTDSGSVTEESCDGLSPSCIIQNVLVACIWFYALMLGGMFGCCHLYSFELGSANNSPLMVECFALQEGLLFAAVNEWKISAQSKSFHGLHGPVVDDICSLLSTLNCSCNFGPQFVNGATHSLARFGFSVGESMYWTDSLPHWLSSVVSEECCLV